MKATLLAGLVMLGTSGLAAAAQQEDMKCSDFVKLMKEFDAAGAPKTTDPVDAAKEKKWMDFCEQNPDTMVSQVEQRLKN